MTSIWLHETSVITSIEQRNVFTTILTSLTVKPANWWRTHCIVIRRQNHSYMAFYECKPRSHCREKCGFQFAPCFVGRSEVILGEVIYFLMFLVYRDLTLGRPWELLWDFPPNLGDYDNGMTSIWRQQSNGMTSLQFDAIEVRETLKRITLSRPVYMLTISQFPVLQL